MKEKTKAISKPDSSVNIARLVLELIKS